MDTSECNSVIENLSTSLEHLARKALETEPQGVVEFTRAFVAMRTVRDLLEEVSKSYDKTYNEIRELRLPQAFEAAGVPTVNLDEGYRVTVSHSVRASVKGGAKDAAYEWLRQNGLGDIVTETVNSSTLSALARSMAEENRELDSDLFNVAIIPTTSVTKVKK